MFLGLCEGNATGSDKVVAIDDATTGGEDVALDDDEKLDGGSLACSSVCCEGLLYVVCRVASPGKSPLADGLLILIRR